MSLEPVIESASSGLGRNWDEECFGDNSLGDKFLADRHLDEECFADNSLGDKFLADKPLDEECFGDKCLLKNDFVFDWQI